MKEMIKVGRKGDDSLQCVVVVVSFPLVVSAATQGLVFLFQAVDLVDAAIEVLSHLLDPIILVINRPHSILESLLPSAGVLIRYVELVKEGLDPSREALILLGDLLLLLGHTLVLLGYTLVLLGQALVLLGQALVLFQDLIQLALSMVVDLGKVFEGHAALPIGVLELVNTVTKLINLLELGLIQRLLVLELGLEVIVLVPEGLVGLVGVGRAARLHVVGFGVDGFVVDDDDALLVCVTVRARSLASEDELFIT
ncbi:hypothetical protein QBC46DRAFT_166909 [Diplogelasinospora grovesii]|uniref:Uncharacterized protein n=1 Tax=Diplogelasinospora grovesii TaxID=303347 RepID=A0AAN6NI85_9PEZI|nr:hypothetical protein QBC46DRAFT_166909 [Diplogelasinospora grovesii]